MKKFGYGKLAIVFLSVGVVAAGVSENAPATVGVMEPVMILSFFGMLAFWIAWLFSRKEERAEKKAAKRAAREEKREKARQELAEYNSPENKAKREEERRKKAAEDLLRRAEDRRPVSAVLISTDSKKSGLGTAGRAVVGGALLGPVGALAGATSGTSKTTKATFSVKYASGRTSVETVEINSKRFRELSALLHK